MFCKLIAVLLLISLMLLPVALSAPAYATEEPFPISTISLGKKGWDNGSPSGVAIDHETNLVYVASRNSDTVTVIDSATNKVVDIITVGPEPWDMAVNSDTHVIYTVNRSPGTVSVINGTTNEVVATLDYSEYGTRSVQSIAVNMETNKVYVLLNNGPARQALVSVIDGASNEIESTFKVADLKPDYDVLESTRAIAVNSKMNMVYVTRDSGALLVIDGSDNRVVNTIATGRMPNSIGVNEQTDMIYVSNFASQSISVIDGSTGKVVADVTPLLSPQQIEIDEETNTIYVTGDGVSVIDGVSHKVTNQIKVGESPEGVAFNPDNGLLFVANALSNSVSLIELGHLGWQTAFAVGRFSYAEPPKPDQIFKIQYRVINGTAENFRAQIGASANVSSVDGGILEIKYPRNYPYTNSNSDQFAPPLLFINGMEPPQVPTPEITECFFVFSIPFEGNAEIGLAWAYLATNFAFHGDVVPDHCIPETVVQDVVVKKGGTISPFHQFQAGVNAQDVMCGGVLELPEYRLVVHPDGKPYCVTRESATELIQRWGVTVPARPS